MPDGQARPATMHEAAWDWLLTCPHVGELFFGFATAREGGTLLVPVTACMDSAETEFVDGSSIRNYDLTIVRFCLYTAAPDDRENPRRPRRSGRSWPTGWRRRARRAATPSCPQAARR